jgi:hypothetical protein
VWECSLERATGEQSEPEGHEENNAGATWQVLPEVNNRDSIPLFMFAKVGFFARKN